MVALVLSLLSLLFQSYAVILSVRLVAITRHRLAWGSIALGLLLILGRRVFELAGYLDLRGFEPNLLYTLISVSVSICMAVGMHLAKQMIDRMMEASERLTASEAYYRGLMEFGTEATFIVDKNGRYLNANSRGLELTGYTLAQLTQLTVNDMIDPEEVKRKPIQWDELRTGRLLVSTRKFIRADRTPFSAELHTRQLADGNFMSSVRDISSHVQAEDQLRFQASLLDTVQQAVIAYDLHLHILYCNQYAAELYGWHRNAVIGENILKTLKTNASDDLMEQARACLDTGRRWTGEVRYLDTQGNWSPGMFVVSPLYDQHQQRIGAIIVTIDLTELQAAEQAAARAENLLREFIDTAPFGAHHYELLPNGELVFTGANQTAERILHFDHSTLIGRRIQDAFPSHIDTPIPEIYRSVALTGVPWESAQVRYSDGVIDGAYEVSAFQTGTNKMVALFKDVTDRVRSEEGLRQREIRLQIVNDIARGITTHESVESILERALMSMFQAYPQYRVVYSEISEDDRMVVKRSLQPSGRASLTGVQLDGQLLHLYMEKLRDGDIISIPAARAADAAQAQALDVVSDIKAVLAAPVKLNGATVGALGFDSASATDWTEYEMKLLLEVSGYLEIAFRDAQQAELHRIAEESLRKSEERFRTLTDNLPAFVWITDDQGSASYFSKPAIEASGCTRDELLGMGWLDHVHPEDRPEFVRQFRAAMAVSAPFECTIRFRRADGAYRYIINRGAPQLNSKGAVVGYVGSCIDITDRIESQIDSTKSLAQLKLAMLAGHSGAFEYDITTNRLYWSEELQSLYGLQPGTFEGRFDEWTDRILPEELEATLAALQEDIALGGGMRNQFRIRRKDTEEIRWIEACGQVLYDDSGKPARIIGVNTDISERKNTELELKHSERLSSCLRTVLSDLNRCRTIEETFEPILSAAFELTGLNGGGVYIISENAAELQHHRGLPSAFVAAIQSMPLTLPAIQTVMELGRIVYLPVDLPDIRELCEQHHIHHIYSMPLHSGRGEIFGFLNLASFNPVPASEKSLNALEVLVSEVGIVFHRLRAERALEEEAVRRQILVDQSTDGIVIVDQDARVCEANHRFAEMLGYTPDEVLTLHVWDWDSQWNQEQILEIVRQVGAKGTIFETLHRRKDGSTYVVEVSCNGAMFGGEKRIFSVCRDISARKSAEQAVRDSEARLSQAQSLAKLGSYDILAATGDAVFSDEVYRILGYTPGSVTPSLGLLLNHIHPEDIEQVHALRGIHVAQGKLWQFSCRIVRADGAERHVTVMGQPILDESGMVHRIVGTVHDITEQHLAETALKLSESHYRAIADFTYDWEFWRSPDGHLIYVSPSCARISGYSPQEFLDNPGLMEQIIHPDDHSRFQSHSPCGNDLRETGAVEIRIIDRFGNERWISYFCRPIYGEDEQYLGVRGSISDITERKQTEADRTRLEEQLRLAQKLETIGTMAAGIAHDFNNLLVPIIGYTELISTETLPGKFSNEYLQEVLKAAYRAKGLVSHILAFSRQQTAERRPTQMDLLIQDVIAMLTTTLEKNILVNFVQREQISPVLADPGQISQVLMNLCENAAHAMSSGGTLTIELSPFEASPLTCPYCKRRLHGKMVHVLVNDTGCGMDESTLKRIFDPFFTTKGVGKGTGLGLAVTHGIVTQHSGHICAESTLGVGSTFHLYLPVANAIQPTLFRELPRAQAGGSESILIIDDDVAVAQSHAASLNNLGYRTTIECDPNSAIQRFADDPRKFDCVLLDQRMPELSGDQVAVQLLRIRPNIPIVVCSGFSDSLGLRTAQDLGIRDVIMKPVITEDLGRAIRKALGNGETVVTR